MQPDQALDRLLLLTLTLEDALRREDYDEADSLFRQRDRAMDQIAPLGIPRSNPKVAQILASDQRLGLFLATRSQEAAEAIRRVQNQTRARRAYQAA